MADLPVSVDKKGNIVFKGKTYPVKSDANVNAVPKAALTDMAHAILNPPNGITIKDKRTAGIIAHDWLASLDHKGIDNPRLRHSLINLYSSLYTLSKVKAKPVGLPGEPIRKALSATEILQALWAKVTSANFWLRALEITIGVLLLAVGVAHMSKLGNKVVKSTPIGKMI